jgi:hypothetical protein
MSLIYKYKDGNPFKPKALSSETTQMYKPLAAKLAPKSVEEAKARAIANKAAEIKEQLIEDAYTKWYKEHDKPGKSEQMRQVAKLGQFYSKEDLDKKAENNARERAIEQRVEENRPIDDDYIKEKAFDIATMVLGPEEILAKGVLRKALSTGVGKALEKKIANKLASKSIAKNIDKEVLESMSPKKGILYNPKVTDNKGISFEQIKTNNKIFNERWADPNSNKLIDWQGNPVNLYHDSENINLINSLTDTQLKNKGLYTRANKSMDHVKGAKYEIKGNEIKNPYIAKYHGELQRHTNNLRDYGFDKELKSYIDNGGKDIEKFTENKKIELIKKHGSSNHPIVEALDFLDNFKQGNYDSYISTGGTEFNPKNLSKAHEIVLFNKPNNMKLIPDKNFKSEINWEAWNKEIPENKDLMNEYHAIEQSTKADKSWMKNPDGSKFEGTPEQFVQQNSENFKKSFPEYHGEILNHNSNSELNMFDESFFDKGAGDSGFYGKGTYAHPKKEYTKMYGKNNYELYLNSKNKGFLDKNNIDDAEYFKRSDNEILQHHLPEYENRLMNYNLDPSRYYDNAKENWFNKLNEQVKAGKTSRDKLDEFTSLHNLKNGEVVIPFNNRVKSARGNNGMFDMTNPNIYKALIPAIAGTAAMQQKKKGGLIYKPH